MKAVIYCRVSTKDQADEGFSLARQEEENKLFAAKQGYEVVKVFVERGESAKTQNRTEFQKMIKYCAENRKNIDALIIWKLDRLTRNMDDQVEIHRTLAKFNIKILTTTETNEESAAGKFLRNILGSAAQYENDIKSERTIAGMKQAILEGKWAWRPPLGYKKDHINNNIMPDSKKGPLVKKAFELYATGLYEQVQIIEILRQDGLELNANHLCRMLKNDIYRGYIVKYEWHPEPIKGNFEPIVDEETFFKVQAILTGRKPLITAYKRNNPDFPLRMFIICPNCNQPLTASWSKGRSEKYPYYHCKTKACNAKLRVKKEVLEGKFVKHLKKIKPDKGLTELFMTIVGDVLKTSRAEQKRLTDKLNNSILQLNVRKDKLLDIYIDGKVSEEDYRLKSGLIEAKIKALKIDLNTNEIPDNDMQDCISYCTHWLNNIDELWLNNNLDTKQRIQKLIFPQGLTYDFDKFRTAELSIIFNILGILKTPDNKMVPPREFESHRFNKLQQMRKRKSLLYLDFND